MINENTCVFVIKNDIWLNLIKEKFCTAPEKQN